MEFLEQFTGMQIFGFILIILIFGGFLWKVTKRIFTILFIIILLILGLYFVEPEILNDWFGEENVQKVEKIVQDESAKLKEKTKETTINVLDSIKSE